MKKLPAIVLAAGAALAMPALAETVTTYYYDAPTGMYVKKTVVYDEPAVYYSRPDTVYYTPPATTYYSQPGTVYYPEPTTVTYVEPPIIVTAPYSEDQAINNDVMDRIASDPTIHGRVGVDTYMDKVTLSGRVGTPWQAEKAQSHAQSVPGVREVDNQIRARIGG